MSRGSIGRGGGGPEFETNEVTGLKMYTYSDRLKKRLEDMGISDSYRPVLEEDHEGLLPGLVSGEYFNGRLPSSPKRLNLDQLNSLHWLFMSWFRYLTYQKNLIAAERSEALRQKEFLWSHIRKQYSVTADGKKNSDQTKSDMARCDYRFIKANARYEEVNALYNCMEATLDVAENDLKVISRAVTVEQIKLEKDSQGAGFRRRLGSTNWSGRETDDADRENESKPFRRTTEKKAPPGRPFKR